jgi:hypothetical protein
LKTLRYLVSPENQTRVLLGTLVVVILLTLTIPFASHAHERLQVSTVMQRYITDCIDQDVGIINPTKQRELAEAIRDDRLGDYFADNFGYDGHSFHFEVRYLSTIVNADYLGRLAFRGLAQETLPDAYVIPDGTRHAIQPMTLNWVSLEIPSDANRVEFCAFVTKELGVFAFGQNKTIMQANTASLIWLFDTLDTKGEGALFEAAHSRTIDANAALNLMSSPALDNVEVVGLQMESGEEIRILALLNDFAGYYPALPIFCKNLPEFSSHISYVTGNMAYMCEFLRANGVMDDNFSFLASVSDEDRMVMMFEEMITRGMLFGGGLSH